MSGRIKPPAKEQTFGDKLIAAGLFQHRRGSRATTSRHRKPVGDTAGFALGWMCLAMTMMVSANVGQKAPRCDKCGDFRSRFPPVRVVREAHANQRQNQSDIENNLCEREDRTTHT